jgi:pyridoxine 5-phosphate synthase
MTKLSVNVNKIATLRNTRPQLNIPDLVRLSHLALQAGADGITIHPRPDERHIRGVDVGTIANVVAEFADAEFNIEGNPFHGRFMDHCRDTHPAQATLVPDSEGQSTSDHGWDLKRDGERLKPIIATLKSFGCRVSLFMDPVAENLKDAKWVGADRVELYTEPYASAFAKGDPEAARPYAIASWTAKQLGLGVNAGHDLNLQNLAHFLQMTSHVMEVRTPILEVSIGHALIADALELGLAEAVRRYVILCRG